MSLTFTKAVRTAAKLKILLDGPSGSGKTLGALTLAKGISKDGRVAVIDSEKGRASYYADRIEFDTLVLENHAPDSYRAAIKVAEEAGYGTIVIDSLSHAWLHVLAEKERYDRENPRSNSWTNWRLFGPKWEKLIASVLASPTDIICTARSKQAYGQVENGGSKKVLKLGLQPVLREGTEYEFALHFAVNAQHRAEAMKDNTFLFAGEQMWDLCAPEVARMLVEWQGSGEPLAPKVRAGLATLATIDDVLGALEMVSAADAARAKRTYERNRASIEGDEEMAQRFLASATDLLTLARRRAAGDEPVVPAEVHRINADGSAERQPTAADLAA